MKVSPLVSIFLFLNITAAVQWHWCVIRSDYLCSLHKWFACLSISLRGETFWRSSRLWNALWVNLKSKALLVTQSLRVESHSAFQLSIMTLKNVLKLFWLTLCCASQYCPVECGRFFSQFTLITQSAKSIESLKLILMAKDSYY